MHLICYYPYCSSLCTFWPYHPYLLLQFIYSLHSGVARHRNLVGHKYGKWSLVTLTYPQLTQPDTQSSTLLKYNMDCFCCFLLVFNENYGSFN